MSLGGNTAVTRIDNSRAVRVGVSKDWLADRRCRFDPRPGEGDMTVQEQRHP
jgi:hypothetical protein